MKIRFLISFVLISSIILAQAPDRNYFRPPVDIPLVLSGNFGELRSNHFHSGIDIKTQGKTGLPIYAAADGEISRIRISPYGFGLALYLDHPNGQTTVYGHLMSFRDDIQEYAKKIQYERKSFDVDLAIPKGTFSVNKGDQIALSGNTGGSGGPHLHFEIRDTDSQHPLNPLLFNFPIKDEIKPKILSAAIYPLTDDSHVYGKAQKTLIETVFYGGAYHLKGNPTVPVYGNIGFGLQTIDYLNGSWSKCGIYEIKLKVDNQAIYSFQMNELSFDETRYLNSYIDYEYYRTNYRRLQKSWVEPGNKLSNYRKLINGGIVDLSDEEVHDIDYEVIDTYGNKSTLSFRVQSKQMNIVPKERNGKLISYKQKATIEKEQLKAVFEPGTFYSDFYMDLETKPANNLYYSKLYQVQDDHHPVHQHYSLKIKADGLPSELRDKALIAAVSEKSGRKWSMGGNYENGWITARVRQLGTFAISVDTVAPKIKPLSIYNNSRLTEPNCIRFKISDDFSGIASYNGQIDGNWVLFEYDAKNALITYYFDKKRFQFDQKHELKLRVKDGKGNTTEYLATFYK